MPDHSSSLPSYVQGLPLTASECVVRDSAKERQGGFFGKVFCQPTEDSTGTILSDGNTAYLLGEIRSGEQLREALKEVPHNSILGRADPLRRICSEKEYLFIPKDFAFLQSKDQFTVPPPLPDHISVRPAVSIEQLHDFCLLKSEFFFEESKAKVSVDNLISHAKDIWKGIKPAVLFSQNKAIGMISSNLNSTESAMINMLYIAKQERAKGYGSLLIRWYMSYLLSFSRSLCLFYSPNNSAAIKLYGSLGFKKKENWILALKS